MWCYPAAAKRKKSCAGTVTRLRSAMLDPMVLGTDAGLSSAGPLVRLVAAFERAARAGWAQTARRITLLAGTAAAVALVLLVGQ